MFKERNHTEEIGTKGKIILQYTLDKYNVIMQNELNYL
jgi:hypothetical protein